MTEEPADPTRPYNLYDPLPGDHGAHGRFDARSHQTSWQWWVTKNRGWLGLAGAGAIGLAWLATRHRNSER